MNQFIFCAIVDGAIQYGTLQASDGREARSVLDERYKNRNVKKLEIKGVASKSFDFDVVGEIYVQDN